MRGGSEWEVTAERIDEEIEINYNTRQEV